MSLVSDFHRGLMPDHRGRLVQDIWPFDFRELEATHDYIQWLFPAWTRSQFLREAPLLNESILRNLIHRDELKPPLMESLDLMLDFNGLTREDERTRTAPHFDERSLNWLSSGNHNHLRLTRFPGAVWNLGGKPQAVQLFDCLDNIAEEYPDCITDKTQSYWAEAVRRLEESFFFLLRGHDL